MYRTPATHFPSTHDVIHECPPDPEVLLAGIRELSHELERLRHALERRTEELENVRLQLKRVLSTARARRALARLRTPYGIPIGSFRRFSAVPSASRAPPRAHVQISSRRADTERRTSRAPTSCGCTSASAGRR